MSSSSPFESWLKDQLTFSSHDFLFSMTRYFQGFTFPSPFQLDFKCFFRCLSHLHKQLDLNWEACKLRWRTILKRHKKYIEWLEARCLAIWSQFQGKESKAKRRQEKLSYHFDSDFRRLWIRDYFHPCHHHCRMQLSSPVSFSLCHHGPQKAWLLAITFSNGKHRLRYQDSVTCSAFVN